MNCPFCQKHIHGMTGFQEAENFRTHLNRCKKNRENTISDGKRTVNLGKQFDIRDALRIRADSGQ